MNKFSITTKTGDQGLTRLFSGEKVLKNSSRLETYGDLDELVSLLSIARHSVTKKELKSDILFIQRQLFTIGSELATTETKLSKLKERVDVKFLEGLETKRIALEEKVEIPRDFIIPGNTLSSAYLDLARAVSRRCERKVVGLISEKSLTNETILIWFNRLSDYLYLMARYEEGTYLLAKEKS